MTVSYLDVDDEITGAVARLRAADDRDVLLVLPPGSHIATSRINFRLLAREARDRHKRLAIASGESGTRAVAVSAGLPAFASVDEWQESLRVLRGGGGGGGSSGRGGAAAGLDRADDDDGTVERAETSRDDDTSPGPWVPARAAPPAAPARPRAPAPPPGRAPTQEGAPPARGRREESQATRAHVPPVAGPSTTLAGAGRGAAGGAAIARAASVPLVSSPGGEATTTPRADDPWAADTQVFPRPAEAPPRATGHTRVEGHARPGRRRRVLLASVLAVLALFVVLGGAAAYVLLPSATVRITPLTERVGPITLTITADPSASEPDGEAGVVPAETITLPLRVSGTYPATGVRVNQTNATGTVVFENLDPSDSNSIPAGAIVATDSDIRFATTAGVTVPASTIQGRTVVPGRAEVGVRAVAPGPGGNVAANAIRNVPADENPALLEVRNPAATTGGSRTETRFVQEADYTAALAELEESLDAALAAALAAPGVAPQGTTLFPETARMSEATPEPAADAVVGQRVAEFELALAAEATAYAVDESALEPLAAERLTSSIPRGWQIFPDSIETSHDSGQVAEDGTITFAVRAAAEQWRPLDAEALRAEIRGLPVDEARQRLAEYGEVEVETWPSFANAIPTIDSRLEIEVLPPSRSSS